MQSRDVAQTQLLLKMAREFVKGTNIDPHRVLAGLPSRTLLLDFVVAASQMNTKQLAQSFPLLTRHIDLVHNNNPLDFDWESLAIAVDNIHGFYVGGRSYMLNT